MITPIAPIPSNTAVVKKNQVTNHHKSYDQYLPQWTITTDTVAGAQAVKSKTTTYLPRPDPTDTSPEANERYQQYLLRAYFYNFTGRTLEGLVGYVFAKQTLIILPPRLTQLADNIDGRGMTLDQLAKINLKRSLQHGRAGLFVDYPKRAPEAGPATVEDLDKGRVRPKILCYSAFDIINWGEVEIGGVVMLNLVVLRELYKPETDATGFGQDDTIQYRVLRLDVQNPEQPFYTQEIWRQDGGSQEWTISEGPFVPTKADGQPFDTIPFKFIGWETNTPDVNSVPLYDLADLNLAHYRNSADFEESTFIIGQPQMVFEGVTKDWVKDVWKGKGIKFGSRSAIALGPDAKAQIIQAEPNTLAEKGMELKQRQAVALGAVLVEEKSVQRTATEADQNQSTKVSVLSSSADNTSDAITAALEWAGMFIGEEQGMTKDPNGKEVKIIDYALNTDFEVAKMDAQERQQLIAEYQAQVISWTEVRTGLKAAGVAFQEDKKARDEIDNDPNNMNPLDMGLDPLTGLPVDEEKTKKPAAEEDQED
jgi:hypothetical protein